MPTDDEMFEKPHQGDPAVSGAGGLYDGFEGYRTSTDSDYHEVLTQGMITLDTNVLLNLYRYSQSTRSDLLSVMRSFGDRMFVPHQVMLEFWRNREAVLRDPLRGVATAKELSNNRERATDTIRSWANQIGLSQGQANEFCDIISGAFSEIVRKVTQISEESGISFANNAVGDPVLAELEPLLQGRVGERLSESEYEQALSEAELRARAKIPPGYKDAAKATGGAAGDYLIWLQIIREAKLTGRDVLVVTSDVKEDWWRREHGELRGPRPELVQEIKQAANVRLFMLRPEALLQRASSILPVKVHDKSVEDAVRVDRIQEEASEAANELDLNIVRRSWEEIMKLVKPRSKVAYLLLGSSSVSKVNRREITLEFPRPADAEAFIKRQLDRVLAEAVYQFFDIDVEVLVTPLRSEW